MFRLLCITAHPDDEAGAFGGTLALYADRGVEVSVVCLTAGTAAKNRGTARTDEELAALRTAEFRASCEFLGVRHGEVLSYPDSKLDRANFYEVVGELVARIRRLRPHVVAHLRPGRRTHRPSRPRHGRNLRHPGISMGGAPRPLSRTNFFGTATARGAEAVLRDGELQVDRSNADVAATVTARIEVGAERFERKNEAFMKHQTQQPLFVRVRKNLGKMPTCEMFHLAATREPQDAKWETDLFEGVSRRHNHAKDRWAEDATLRVPVNHADGEITG